MGQMHLHLPTGLPCYRDMLGEIRLLASFPSLGRMRKMLPPFSSVATVIPRSDWTPLDRRKQFDQADWIFDQDGIGECVACGASGMLRRARALAGLPDVKLSSGALYAQINGGQDNGANISDGLDALIKTGTCSYATVGVSPIYLRQLPSGWQQEASRFRVLKGAHCSTYDELVSGLLLGGVPFYGYQVGNSFENFDKYGVAGHDRGPGNHCNGADGLVKLPDGRWVLDDVNSWQYGWGPFKNGRTYLDENHLFGGGDEPDVCVIWAATDDPQDSNPSPPVTP